MVSDHIAITPDVAEQYPPPFYEPFTTLAWLAGLTGTIRLGTTVLIAPYRHPPPPGVAGQYPPPFSEPFTTLAWLAGLTGTIRLGTTVLIAPYRHPLLI